MSVGTHKGATKPTSAIFRTVLTAGLCVSGLTKRHNEIG